VFFAFACLQLAFGKRPVIVCGAMDDDKF